MSDIKELELTSFGTTSIGSLIAALMFCEPTATVQFDFCYLAPRGFDSYRGFYDHLAVGWDNGDWPQVSEFLSKLQACVGQTFDGWKGGEYTMLEATPIWVANRGEAGYTAMVSVTDAGNTVIINTRYAG